MSNRLGGKQGTAYTGTNANQPPNWSFEIRDPNQYDFNNYSIGDLWLNTVNFNVWVLVSLAGNANNTQLAKWVRFVGGNGDLITLTGNTGGPVFGDINSNINVVGDATTITVVGNPATHTLTASLPTSFFQSGTFVPTIAFGGASVGVTYDATQTKAEWTRVGNMVFISIRLVLTSKGVSVGRATISTLPFTVGSSLVNAQNALVAMGNITLDGGFSIVWANFVPGTTTVQFAEGGIANIPTQNLNDPNFANNTSLNIDGFYFLS